MMEIAIKDLGEIITGNTPSKKEESFWNSEDICFVKPDGIANGSITLIKDSNEYLSENARKKARVVSKDAVFVTCIGSIGKIGIASEGDYAFNQQINVVIPNEKVLPKYLAYNLLFSKERLEAIANAPVVPIINKTQFGEFTISIEESIEKQGQIIRILDELSGIINSRKEELDKLESLIKARFVEMFGNPLDKSKANSIFTDCVVFNPKKSELDNLDIDVSFVPMECVGVDGSFTIKETGKASDYYKGYTYFKDGDVLLAKITPCFENGKVAIAEGCMNGIGFGTTEFHVSRPKEGVSTSYWIKYMLKNDLVHNLATINMTGSAGQKRIQTPFFEKLKVYLPPIEQQNQFAEFVKQVDKSKVVVQKALNETQTLFNSLMQEYFG